MACNYRHNDFHEDVFDMLRLFFCIQDSFYVHKLNGQLFVLR